MMPLFGIPAPGGCPQGALLPNSDPGRLKQRLGPQRVKLRPRGSVGTGPVFPISGMCRRHGMSVPVSGESDSRNHAGALASAHYAS